MRGSPDPVDPGAENWSSLRQGNGSRFILYSRLALLPHPVGAGDGDRGAWLLEKDGETIGI